MLKKLTKHGNSLARVIDRPILDLLKIDPKTPLDVSTDGKRLIVAPAQASARRKKFDAAQEYAHKRYGRAFEEARRVIARPQNAWIHSSQRKKKKKRGEKKKTSRGSPPAPAKPAGPRPGDEPFDNGANHRNAPGGC